MGKVISKVQMMSLSSTKFQHNLKTITSSDLVVKYYAVLPGQMVI